MDEADFDALYGASFGRIVVQVTSMIGNREEARDCVRGDAGVEQYPRGGTAPVFPVTGLAGKGFPF